MAEYFLMMALILPSPADQNISPACSGLRGFFNLQSKNNLSQLVLFEELIVNLTNLSRYGCFSTECPEYYYAGYFKAGFNGYFIKVTVIKVAYPAS